MNTAEILEQFQHVPNKCDFAPFERALRAAIEQRQAITPELIAILERATFDPEQFMESTDCRVELALHLLAQFREPRACNSVIRFLSLPEDVCDAITGDFVTGHGGVALASVCGGDHAPLLRLALNEEVGEFVREQALIGLAVQEIWGERSRKDVLEDLRKLFQTLPRPGDSYVWAALVGLVCDYNASELEPEIRQVHEEELPDESIMGSLDEVLKELLAPDPERLKDFRAQKRPIDTIAEISHWYCFSDQVDESPYEEAFDDFIDLPAGEPGRTIATSEQPYHAPPKTGRNDPCPCGSGRKYKKCCAVSPRPNPRPAPVPADSKPAAAEQAPNPATGSNPLDRRQPVAPATAPGQ